jgi:hypothetical protein
MKTCVLSGTSSYVSAVSPAENVARTQLPARLDSAYRAISAHAPHARVVVIDYPVFYQLGVHFCIGLSATSRAKIDEGINLFDGIISAAAGRRHFTFADVRSRFVGHQLCISDKWAALTQLHAHHGELPPDIRRAEVRIPARLRRASG